VRVSASRPVPACPPSIGWPCRTRSSRPRATGSPDLRWLREGGGDARWYAAGDRVPIGIEAFEGREHNDLVLWVDRVGAVISGDTLADFGRGLGIADWLRAGVTREAVAERLRPLLERPVEVVLPAHGAPTDRATLERALSWRLDPRAAAL